VPCQRKDLKRELHELGLSTTRKTPCNTLGFNDPVASKKKNLHDLGVKFSQWTAMNILWWSCINMCMPRLVHVFTPGALRSGSLLAMLQSLQVSNVIYRVIHIADIARYCSIISRLRLQGLWEFLESEQHSQELLYVTDPRWQELTYIHMYVYSRASRKPGQAGLVQLFDWPRYSWLQ